MMTHFCQSIFAYNYIVTLLGNMIAQNIFTILYIFTFKGGYQMAYWNVFFVVLSTYITYTRELSDKSNFIQFTKLKNRATDMTTLLENLPTGVLVYNSKTDEIQF